MQLSDVRYFSKTVIVPLKPFLIGGFWLTLFFPDFRRALVYSAGGPQRVCWTGDVATTLVRASSRWWPGPFWTRLISSSGDTPHKRTAGEPVSFHAKIFSTTSKTVSTASNHCVLSGLILFLLVSSFSIVRKSLWCVASDSTLASTMASVIQLRNNWAWWRPCGSQYMSLLSRTQRLLFYLVLLCHKATYQLLASEPLFRTTGPRPPALEKGPLLMTCRVQMARDP
jgi:hypothetical protein